MVTINLLPWRDELRAAHRKHFNQLLIIAAVIGMLILLILYLVNVQRIHEQTVRNNFLTQAIASANAKEAGNFNVVKQQKQLINQLEMIQTIYVTRFGIVQALDTLPRVLPAGASLTQLSYTQNQYMLKGAAVSNSQVTALMKHITQSGWAVKPTLSDITDDKQSGIDEKNFTLILK